MSQENGVQGVSDVVVLTDVTAADVVSTAEQIAHDPAPVDHAARADAEYAVDPDAVYWRAWYVNQAYDGAMPAADDAEILAHEDDAARTSARAAELARAEADAYGMLHNPLLLNQSHCALVVFASTEKQRYSLAAVHYDARAGRLEATDGHILVRVPVDTSAAEEYPLINGIGPVGADDILIPSACLAQAAKRAPKRMIKPILNGNIIVGRVPGAPADPAADNRPMIAVGSTDLDNVDKSETKSVDGRFPKTDEVFPDKSAVPAITICYSAELLERLCKYARQHGAGHNPAITFSFYTPDRAATFQIPLEDGTAADGAIMPIVTA